MHKKKLQSDSEGRMNMKQFAIRALGLSLVMALLGAGCTRRAQETTPKKDTAAPTVTSDTGAAALRSGLNRLLSEHVSLAAAAGSAAIAGRSDEFTAAADALNGAGKSNSSDIIAAIGSAYGPDAGKAFDPLWRKHIGFVVDYTTGVAAKDKAKQDKAVNDLLAYTKEFGAFINSANGLPTDAVADLVKTHILTLKAVIDSVAAKEVSAAFTQLREAYVHMGMIAAGLSQATVKKFPEKFDGSTETPAAKLRADLTGLLQEHVYLAAFATGAALGGRETEFASAADALNGAGKSNSSDVIAAIGSAYGPDAAKAFDPLWRKHIGFVVDYTTGVATKDKAKQDKAVNDLLAYTKEFGAFINSANGLPTDTVAKLVEEHILSLKAVIDAQASGDLTTVYTKLREAAAHMAMIADPLAEATVQKFPEKFQA
jgi:hypothetical protein